jgi:acyl carrier protein
MKGQSLLKEAEVREFVVENLFYGDNELVKEDTSFLEEGNTHSWSIVELARFLEETYNIKIENDELVPENIDSLQNIARFIDRKLDRDHVA